MKGDKMKGSKVKRRFYGDDELNKLAMHKFHAEIKWSDFAKRVRGWKFELFAFSLVILFSFSQPLIPKGEILSYWIGMPLFAVFLLYFLIKNLMSEFTNHIDMRYKQIKDLKRQLTCFICEASLGRIEKGDLERLAKASHWRTDKKMDDLTVDDFSIISQVWNFWEKKGFEWQDECECINCGHNRKEHSQDGECPTEKNSGMK
jgi:regulator of replication initiation timing